MLYVEVRMIFFVSVAVQCHTSQFTDYSTGMSLSVEKVRVASIKEKVGFLEVMSSNMEEMI